MSVLESLREAASMPGPASALANDLLVIRENFEQGQLTREEYDFLLREIADIRAQQDLANDEMACRYIVSAAKILLSSI
jgi:hypothetical protein